jgi:hypothetical protein
MRPSHLLAIGCAAARTACATPAPKTSAFGCTASVTAQPGGFCGGWVTRCVVGPFKGGPGSQGW